MQRRRVLIGVVAVGVLAGCTTALDGTERTTSTLASTPVNASVVVSCKGDAKAVEAASEAYHAQVGSWPSNLDVLTQTAVVSGQTLGPWLRRAPTTDHYSIIVDAGTGSVYVYPRGAGQPASYDAANNFDTSDPCSRNAS